MSFQNTVRTMLHRLSLSEQWRQELLSVMLAEQWEYRTVKLTLLQK